MTPEKAQAAIGLCVIMLTRFLMERDGVSMDEAYRTLFATETFKLLSKQESRLFLEEDDYLRECLTIEQRDGIDAFYDFINPVPDAR